MNFFTELRRRNVFRVGIAYIVLGWVMVQATDTVTPALHLPEWTLGFVIWIGVIGFPFALLFAWAFELTPEGIRLERDVDRTESTTHVTGRTLDFLIIGMLIIALGFVTVDQYVLEESVSSEELTTSPKQVEAPVIAEEAAKSIAVLPFVNMSDDNDYFADGLTEEILNLLARNIELRVTARTSSFAFKDRNEDLRGIGSVLGVTSLLEGSVRRSGKRLRVTAQLINVEDGFHIWSETYDREMTDVFELQDDIAGAIFSALEIHLGQAKPKRGQPTQNMAAYEKFLQGRALLSSIERPRSRELFQEAVALDPNFAEAWELLSLANWLLGGGGDLSTQEGRLQSLEAANKALALNPDLMLAAAMRASADEEGFSWLREISALEAALDAHPEDVNILAALIFDLQEAGYFEEALPLSKRAAVIDPLAAFNHGQLGLSLLAVERKQEARASFQKAIELDGFFFGVWAFVELMLSDNQEQAIATLESTYKALGFDASPIRQRVIAAANPATRLETVEAWSEEAARIDDSAIGEWWLYLAFGLQDHLYDKLLAAMPSETIWSDADGPIWTSVAFRDSGFTAHPLFLEVARLNGIVELWEQRGPPDFCRKRAGQWQCD